MKLIQPVRRYCEIAAEAFLIPGKRYLGTRGRVLKMVRGREEGREGESVDLVPLLPRDELRVGAKYGSFLFWR